jgi:hypothetical protein
MDNTFSISCHISTTDASIPLGLEIWLDNQQLFDTDYVQQDLIIKQEFSDSSGAHELRFVLKNKQPEHTKLDATGNIQFDACILIDNIKFDDVELGPIFNQKSVYTHNFNNTGNTIQDEFYGIMGCNGVVSLKFESPVYIWLLENM